MCEGEGGRADEMKGVLGGREALFFYARLCLCLLLSLCLCLCQYIQADIREQIRKQREWLRL